MMGQRIFTSLTPIGQWFISYSLVYNGMLRCVNRNYIPIGNYLSQVNEGRFCRNDRFTDPATWQE